MRGNRLLRTLLGNVGIRACVYCAGWAGCEWGAGAADLRIIGTGGLRSICAVMALPVRGGRGGGSPGCGWGGLGVGSLMQGRGGGMGVQLGAVLCGVRFGLRGGRGVVYVVAGGNWGEGTESKDDSDICLCE